jgi:hypothetical protein
MFVFSLTLSCFILWNIFFLLYFTNYLIYRFFLITFYFFYLRTYLVAFSALYCRMFSNVGSKS